MIANQLTQTISKKLFISLLIVTIGADVALFLSRKSYFMETIYANIMLFSILVAIKLAPSLREQGAVVTKTKHFSNFTKAFFMLFLIGTINNYYGEKTFPEFSEERGMIAEDFSSQVNHFNENVNNDEAYTTSDRVIEWVDTIGADFYDYFMAGFEEVYRLSYIVLFLLLFKKVLPGLWARSSKDSFMIIVIILSSLLFGMGHGLSTEQSWNVWVGTVVVYTNMGLVLGYLLISMRNLWMLIIVHGLYNVLTTMGWSYFEWSTVVFVVFILLVNGLLWLIQRIRANIEEAKSFQL
jgi:hypothetical protein